MTFCPGAAHFTLVQDLFHPTTRSTFDLSSYAKIWTFVWLFIGQSHPAFKPYEVMKWSPSFSWGQSCDGLVSRQGWVKDSHPLNTTETGKKRRPLDHWAYNLNQIWRHREALSTVISLVGLKNILIWPSTHIQIVCELKRFRIHYKRSLHTCGWVTYLQQNKLLVVVRSIPARRGLGSWDSN